VQWRRKLKLSWGRGQTEKTNNFHTGSLSNKKDNAIFLWQVLYGEKDPNVFCGVRVGVGMGSMAPRWRPALQCVL